VKSVKPVAKQLSFENLQHAQRTPPNAVRPNASVPVEIRPRIKRQAATILAALRRGPLWTNDLRSMVAQYNARIKELRVYLYREFGTTVDMTARGRDGNNRYELRPFAGSRYEAELMARQSKRRTIDDGR
jgi:hypothetical protein